MKGKSDPLSPFLLRAPVQSGGRAEKAVSHTQKAAGPGRQGWEDSASGPSSRSFGLEGPSTNSLAAPGAE